MDYTLGMKIIQRPGHVKQHSAPQPIPAQQVECQVGFGTATLLPRASPVEVWRLAARHVDCAHQPNSRWPSAARRSSTLLRSRPAARAASLCHCYVCSVTGTLWGRLARLRSMQHSAPPQHFIHLLLYIQILLPCPLVAPSQNSSTKLPLQPLRATPKKLTCSRMRVNGAMHNSCDCWETTAAAAANFHQAGRVCVS